MNTKSVLLITSDKELSSTIRISALTLTKLNCQVDLRETEDHAYALERSKDLNLNMIISDLDNDFEQKLELIKAIRSNASSSSKKIISVYSGTINKDEIHKAGCDSIIAKDEFRKIVNNILQF